MFTRVDHPWILVRSWQDQGTILAKILSRSCHGIHFAMARSSQDIHVSMINLDKKPKMARKILLRSSRWQKKFAAVSNHIVLSFEVFLNSQKHSDLGTYYTII